jgi:penicillin-binding protein 2
MLKETGDRSIVMSQRVMKTPAFSIRNQDDWSYVKDAMVEVMHGRHGTARGSARKADYRMAGKTGTAQVVSIAQGEKYDADALAERHRDHALFVGYAPADDPQIAVAVIVENGGGGSTSAAPIARAMFDRWLALQDSDDLSEPLDE